MVHLGICSVHTWKCCTFYYCWGLSSILLSRFSWLIVLLSYSLLTFCLVVLWIIEREVLKPRTIILDLSISPFKSLSFSFTYFAALFFVTYTFRIAMSSWKIVILKSYNFPIPSNLLWTEDLTLCDINITNCAFFW